jgi:hypothetical protein
MLVQQTTKFLHQQLEDSILFKIDIYNVFDSMLRPSFLKF